MAVKVKLCFFCKHFDFDGGEPGYSEMTPGYGMHLKCGIGVWDAGEIKCLSE